MLQCQMPSSFPHHQFCSFIPNTKEAPIPGNLCFADQQLLKDTGNSKNTKRCKEQTGKSTQGIFTDGFNTQTLHLQLRKETK